MDWKKCGFFAMVPTQDGKECLWLDDLMEK